MDLYDPVKLFARADTGVTRIWRENYIIALCKILLSEQTVDVVERFFSVQSGPTEHSIRNCAETDVS